MKGSRYVCVEIDPGYHDQLVLRPNSPVLATPIFYIRTLFQSIVKPWSRLVGRCLFGLGRIPMNEQITLPNSMCSSVGRPNIFAEDGVLCFLVKTVHALGRLDPNTYLSHA